MIRILIAWCLGFMLAACAAGPKWVGENLQEVDGYLIAGERPCAQPPSDACALELAAAFAVITPAERASIISASIGIPPSAYEDAGGRKILLSVAGLSRAYPVILSFPDGQRRVIPVMCSPALFSNTGDVVRPGSCVHAPDVLPRAGTPPFAP